jgi:hypothetical protein
MNDEEFLLALRQYIEEVEETIDGEWGMCRTFERMISEGAMPELYAEVLRRIGSRSPNA